MLSPPSSASSAEDASLLKINHSTLQNTAAAKKRSRDDTDARQISSEKKKKRKKADKAELAVADGNVNADEPRKKKKKKKKTTVDAEPAAAVQQALEDEENDSDIDANAQASHAALLNAIVAAVSSTSTPGDQATLPFQACAPLPLNAQPSLPTDLPPFPGPAFPFHLPFGPFPPGAALIGPGVFPGSQVFNDLQFGSNDDILRALQSADVSKLTSGLRGTIDPTLSAFAPPNPNSAFAVPGAAAATAPTAPPSLVAPPIGQAPTGSSTILKVPSKNRPAIAAGGKAASRSTSSSSSATPSGRGNDDSPHADILATKWLNARKLKEMVDTEGLVYKKGKFSATEEQQLTEAMENYKKSRGLDDAGLANVIFPADEKNKDNEFWQMITRAVPQRPIIAVYHHIRRIKHPNAKGGKWKSEEDALLKMAVADLGQAWEKVGDRVGRMGSDCRDRYRNHIQGRETRVTGAWSKEEEDELTRIVTDMTIKQGRDIDNDVFWSRVSQLMGGRRGRQQCRIKWTDALSKLVKNDGTKPRWGPQDAFILVHKVDSMNVNDDTEIDWKTLPDPDWNLWSAHTLQRRWYTMKRSVKGFEEMSHQDIVDILRVKKSLAPDSVSSESAVGDEPAKTQPKKRKERKITSADEIKDDNSPRRSGSTTPGTSA